MKNWKSRIAAIMSFVLVISVFAFPAKQVSAATPVNLNTILTNFSASKSPVESGEIFTYNIAYSFSSIISGANYADVRIDLPLPEGVEYIDHILPDNTVEYIGRTGNVGVGGETVHFRLTGAPNPVGGGSIYTLPVNVRYQSYVTRHLTSGTTAVKFSLPDDPATPGIDETAIKASGNATVTAHANPNWVLEKSMISPYHTVSPKPDQIVQYRIDMQNLKGGSIGNLNIDHVSIVDTLPEHAVFKSASDGGLYDGDRTVEWKLGTLGQSGDYASVTVSVYYPSTTFNDVSSVINTAEAYFTPLGQTEHTISDFIPHGFTYEDQDGGSGMSKWVEGNHQEISPGQTVDFYIGGFRNKANADLGNVGDPYAAEIIDMRPHLYRTADNGLTWTNDQGAIDKLKLLSVQTATFADIDAGMDPANDEYEMFYTTLSNPTVPTVPAEWQSLGMISASTSTSVDLAVYGDDDKGVEGIRFEFASPLPITFQQTSNFKLTYQLDDSFTGYVNGDRIRNRVDWGYGFKNSWTTGSDNADAGLYENRPLVSITKEVKKESADVWGDATRLRPGDIVEYRIVVSNNLERSTASLFDPIIIDVLPEQLEYLGGWELDDFQNLGLPPLTEPIPKISNPKEQYTYTDISYPLSEYTLLRSQFDTPSTVELEKGQQFAIQFKAKIKDYTLPGTYRNRVELTSNTGLSYINDSNFGMGINPGSDLYDHDEDGAFNDPLIFGIADITVNALPSSLAVKEVRGELDDWTAPAGGWSAMGTTLPGGRVQYRMSITNTGNVPVSNVEILDVLPRIDDTGIIDTSPRGSDWGTVLTGPVDVSGLPGGASVDVEYSTDANITYNSSPTWSATLPNDLTTVTAIKFVLDSYTIDPGENLSLIWEMRAPYFAVPPTGEKIAWNSFSYEYTPIGYDRYPPAEPARVGVVLGSLPTGVGEIGNYVWADVNRNGIQDDHTLPINPALLNDAEPYGPNGEPGINGVKIDLLSAADGYSDPIQSTVTSNNALGDPGYYVFTNLPAGTYRVKFHLPDDLNSSVPDEWIGVAEWGFEGWSIKNALSSTPANDSDVGGASVAPVDTTPTLMTSDIVIDSSNWSRLDIDAGLVIRAGEIGDFSWNDINYDGIQDIGELGLDGVKVTLLTWDGSPAKDVNGVSIVEQTTAAGGKYLFTNLPPGHYRVKFDSTTLYDDVKYIYSLKNADGSNVANDSNIGTVHRANGDDAYNPIKETDIFWLPLGGEDMTVDVGLVNATTKSASLGDYVWIDLDNDGTQDEALADYGRNGVAVNLYSVDGSDKRTFITSTVTATHPVDHHEGYYLFEHLAPGKYQIGFELPGSDTDYPNGFMFAKNRIGADGEKDSNVVLPAGSEGFSESKDVVGGNHLRDIDAGLVPLASIGDKVWMDYNKNGIQDDIATNPREIGIVNVPVKLYKAADYDVGTSPNTSGPTHRTTTTNSSGIYKFDKLEPDINYIVEFGFPTANPSSYPAGYPGYVRTQFNLGGDGAKDSDASITVGTEGLSSIIRPGPNVHNDTVDAGLIELASIGDYVWIDMNENGIQDSVDDLLDFNGDGNATDEPGLNGVKVHLLNAAGDPFEVGGVPVTTVTANHPVSGKKGYYLFSHLPYDTTYKVKFEMPDAADYNFDAAFRGWTTKGTDPTAIVVNDSNVGNNPLVAAEYGISGPVNVGVGEHNITIDAGILPPLGKLGDYVWLDEDWDGVQDAAEQGVNGVTVKLLRGDNTPILNVDGITPVTTITYKKGAVDGYYEFDSLQPRSYKVEFEVPSAPKRDFTVKGSDSSSNTDSNANLATGRTDTINLGLGKFNMTLDAGIIGYATIGDTVWLDYDEDGTYNHHADTNPLEVGVSGVTVNLYKAAVGTPNVAPDIIPVNLHRTTTTNASGSYLFDNLQPNYKYIVEFVKPDGYRFTTASAALPSAVDNDSDANITTGLTGEIQALLDAKIVNVDAGLIKLASIGNFVWVDMNKNGKQDDWIDWNGNGVKDASVVVNGKTLDENESGLNGITVNLYKLGALQETMVTTNHSTTGKPGYYLFTDLEIGDYTVEFVKPADGEYGTNVSFPGWTTKQVDSSGTTSGDSDQDSNVNPATARTDIIVVPMGDLNVTIDAGLLPPVGKLGNYVWLDEDWDGVMDVTETGVNGVTVTLLNSDGTAAVDINGAAIAAVLTADDVAVNAGYYEFTNLKPGQYKIEFALPTGEKRWFTVKGAVGTSDTDSNVNVPLDKSDTTAQTDIINLAVGGSNMTIDAGLIPYATIGNLVWLDFDGDGTYNYHATTNPDEVGIPNVTVKLYKSATESGVPVTDPALPSYTVLTTTTDVDGNYIFEDLQPNYNYQVEFEPPTGYTFTTASLVGPVVADHDSDATDIQLTYARTGVIKPAVDANIVQVDAGLYTVASIGNYVWIDMDRDGTTAGDIGIDWNGDGILNGIDWDGDSVLDNVVWMDFNNNNTVDPGELVDETKVGLNGITVNLYRQSAPNTVYKTDVTKDNPAIAGNPGYYIFEDLSPGKYIVEFVAPAVGAYGTGVSFPGFTSKGTSGTLPNDSDIDSNANVVTGRSDVITVFSNEFNKTIDAGLLQPVGKLGNYVWFDENWNGIQDLTEDGIIGVTVKLLYADGTPVMNGVTPITTTTNAVGYYEFDNLAPAQYQVEFTLPSGLADPIRRFTDKEAGLLRGDDSNVNVPVAPDSLVTARTGVINLSLGETNMTIDAGAIEITSIGNYVWMDKNVNGTQDGGELGVPGVTVKLYRTTDLASSVATSTTALDGSYLFDHLDPKFSYVVEFVLPSGYAFTTRNSLIPTISDLDSDANPDSASATFGRTGTINPPSGARVITIDAGLIELVDLGNYVWHDENGNGIQDGGELGINGVIVKLYDAADPANLIEIESQTTANMGILPGYYLFTDLSPGDYIVEFEQPTAYPTHLFTNRYVGGNVELDSDAGTDGRSSIITLIAGEDNLTVDGGVTEPASIGNFVWIDANANGIQEASELGMNDVKVELYDVNNVKLTEMDTINDPITGLPGYYLFDKLLPGDYQIKFEVPSIYYVTMKRAGGSTALDSDIGMDGTTEFITLAPGDNNLDIDAGIVLIPIVEGVKSALAFASLGNYVWSDDNRDGLQDASESGVNGVTVELYNENNALINTTVTANKNGQPGYYQFTQLLPNFKYSVRFTLPDGYAFTIKGVAADKELDSNVDNNGFTEAVLLGNDDNNLSVDAGLIKLKPVSLGNYVWHDENEDGLQDNKEPGINFITVELYDNAGKLIQSMLTAPDEDGKPGYYLFTNLIPGKYEVKFVIPTGMKFTTASAGKNGARDSNPSLDGSTDSITLAEGESDITIDAGIVLDAKAGLPPEEISEQLDEELIPVDIPELDKDEGNQAEQDKVDTKNIDTGKQAGQLPKTGETAPMLPWLGFLMMAASAALWWRQRLKRNA